MLEKAIEHEGDVDKVLSGWGLGKALLGIKGSSRAGRPPKSSLKGQDKTAHCADLKNGSRCSIGRL